MKMPLIPLILATLSLSATLHAHSKEEIQDALTVICDRPEALFTAEHEKALKVFTASFPANHLAKLGLTDEALAWLPEFGPCGGPGSPLLIAFAASAARDDISGRKEGVVYRGWRVVLRHYAHLRKTAPDDFTAIPALEEMSRKEKLGVLLEEAHKVEQKKEPISTSHRSPRPQAAVAHLER